MHSLPAVEDCLLSATLAHSYGSGRNMVPGGLAVTQ